MWQELAKFVADLSNLNMALLFLAAVIYFITLYITIRRFIYA